MKVRFQRKLRNPQKYSTNKLLGSFKRAIDTERKDSKYKITTLPGMINSPQAILDQTARIEIELKRNRAILYANTIPPR